MADDTIIDAIAKNIADIESRGQENPYAAEGPPSGHGDRPYGKYQVMGNNVPAWTEEAGLGRMSPRQFMANPDAQEKTVRTQLSKLYDKYGNAKDVASVWHAGVPYDKAEKEGRADVLGTHTVDYASHVAKGIDPEAPPAAPEAPSVDVNTVFDNPEFWKLDDTNQKYVLSQVSPDFAQLDAENQGFVLDQKRPAGLTSTTTTRTTTPEAATIRPATPREMSVEEAGREINKAYGQPDDHWTGRYTAALGKPAADKLSDLYDALTKPSGVPGMEDLEAIKNVLEVAAIPASAVANVADQAMKDINAPPALQKIVSFFAGLAMGAKTPLPGAPEAPAIERPFAGTQLTRTAAAETATAAERAGTWAQSARATGEAAAKQATAEAEATAAAGAQKVAETKAAGEAATTAAQREAEDVAARGRTWTDAQRRVAGEETTAAETEAEAAQRAADEAAATAAPSPAVTERAKAALTPAGVTPEQGGQVIKGGLTGQLEEGKDAAGSIYDAFVENNKAAVPSDPAALRSVVDTVSLAENELGPLFKGETESILTTLRDRIIAGDLPTVDELNTARTRLNELLRSAGKSRRSELLNKANDALRTAMRSASSDPEELAWLKASDALWRDEYVGRGMTQTSLGELVKAIKKSDPATVVEKLFKEGTTDQQATIARAVMRRFANDPSGADEAIRQSVFARLLRPDAEGNLDPRELLKRFDNWHPEFRKTFTNDGADAFFKALRQEQEAADAAAETASAAAKRATTVARTGKAAVREAESTAATGVSDAERQAAEVERGATADVTTASREAAKVTKAAAKRAKDVAASTAEETEATAKVAAGARQTAESAAATAAKPNRLAMMTARGLKIASAGLTEAIAKELGLGGFYVHAAGVAELMIPTSDVAKFLANSKTANLFARALRTQANSAAVPYIMSAIRNSDVVKAALKSPEGQKKKAEARAVLSGKAA